MSEFSGPISEFPGVSIDRFNGENLKSTVYFLSHCHTDHMVGLNEPDLFERLKQYILKIYCQKVSAALLSALPLYVNLTPYIIPLDSDNETTLNVSLEGDETHTLTVTLVPAGHCPGPVMFLLVSKEKPVLFTGNFRWQADHTKQINHLFHNLKEAAVHSFYNIFIDTTFCKTDSNFIPCTESCLLVIFQAVSAWLCSFQNNVVHFCNKTRYGYEFLMKELVLRFKTKVHVSLCQYQLYQFNPSIQNWLTLDGESTKIHFCKHSSASANLKLPCKPDIPSPEVLTIIPTVMFFTKNEIMLTIRTTCSIADKTKLQ